MNREDAQGSFCLNRRDFLKGAGATALASLALSSGCNIPDTTPGTMPASSQSTPPIPEAQTETPLNSTTAITQVAVTSQPAISGQPTSEAYAGNYTPSEISPPLIAVPGGDSKVATDRFYSIQHIWVKEISPGFAVIGITDKLQMLITYIDHIVIPMVGDEIFSDLSFSYIEGGKMNVELVSPISGRVVERNDGVLATNRGLLGPINTDPYGRGWMLVVKLTKAAELESLLTAEEYADLQAKAV